MVVKDTYLFPLPVNVITALSSIVDSDWRIIPLIYGTTELIYYTNLKADVFSVRKIKGGILLRKMIPVKKRKGRPNKNKVPAIQFATGERGGRYSRSLDRCVYSAFRGEWIYDGEIEHIDGDCRNCALQNLRFLYPTIGNAEIMQEYSKEYSAEFSRIVATVSFKSYINKEDAEDVVQNTFIELTRPDKPIRDFTSLWVYQSKKRALDLKKSFRKRKIKNTGIL